MLQHCDEGTALIVGLPWLRTGTGKVMETQIKYFRSKGLRTVFVAVPHNTGQRRSDGVWSNFSALSQELGAEKTIVATFDHRVRKGGVLGRWLSARRKINAMHWAMKAASISPIPEELDLELKSGRVKYLLVNHIYALQFGLRLKERLHRFGQKVALILVTHDVQSHILLDNEIKNPFTRKQDTLDSLLTTEIQALKSADVLVHVSADDKHFFENALPNIPHVLALPTSDDLSGVKHSFPMGGRRDLLFVGSSHIGNYHAIEWFFSRVRPWLGASPLSMMIVGTVEQLLNDRDRNLYEKIKDHLIGSAAETLPYYLMANCVVIPMVGGRGVSIKTVEATAIGRPLVGTSFAFRGLPVDEVKAAGFKTCDEPREFALEILDALENPEPKQQASRRLFLRLFGYDRFEKAMDEAVYASSRLFSPQKSDMGHPVNAGVLINEHC